MCNSGGSYIVFTSSYSYCSLPYLFIDNKKKDYDNTIKYLLLPRGIESGKNNILKQL